MRPYSKKKFIRLRLFSLCLGLAIMVAIAAFFFGNGSNQLPNFHGWVVQDVLDFIENNENLTVNFELVHSEDMIPARVVSQSYPPGMTIEESMTITVEISLGIEVP